MLTLLLVLLLVALLFGGYGHNAGWGLYGWSPVMVLLVVLLVLILVGHPL